MRLKLDTMTGTGRAMTSTPLSEQTPPTTLPAIVFGTMSPYLQQKRKYKLRAYNTKKRNKKKIGYPSKERIIHAGPGVRVKMFRVSFCRHFPLGFAHSRHHGIRHPCNLAFTIYTSPIDVWAVVSVAGLLEDKDRFHPRTLNIS